MKLSYLMISHGYYVLHCLLFILVYLELGLCYDLKLNLFFSLQSWIYDRKNNKGKFANYHAHKQRTSECPRLRGSRKSSDKTDESPKEAEPIVMYSHINDLQLSKEVSLLELCGYTSLNLN